MNDNTGVPELDAAPQLSSSVNQNQNITSSTVRGVEKCSRKTLITLKSILDEFTVDDYRSFFFLLLDFLDKDKKIAPGIFLSLSKKDISILKKEFFNLFAKKLNEKVLLEILGTTKKYQKLKLFNTCHHVFKQTDSFNEISEIRKVLYSLCEEITDEDLTTIKHYLPPHVRDEIECAEEWFISALQLKVISNDDLSELNNVFKDCNPECLKIIEKYKVEPNISYYTIRPTTLHCHCGIAAIFNFKAFDLSYSEPDDGNNVDETSKKPALEPVGETSKKPNLEPRVGSEVDVDSLEELWNIFGFETHVHENLTASELVEQLSNYAKMNHNNYDIFVGCFLSHGDSGVIYTSDAVPLTITSLLGIITESCDTLVGKPKLFFIQACQGSKSVSRTTCENIQSKNENQNEKNVPSDIMADLNYTYPALQDIFLAMSTINGYSSWRSPTNGSPFVQILCDIMKKFGDSTSVDDIMTKVTYKLSKQKDNYIQIVPTLKTFTKKLMLKKRTDI